MHNCYFFLQNSGADRFFKSDSSKAALIFGSLMHDVDHGGRNNNFMIKSYSAMARRYNDLHVTSLPCLLVTNA